MTPQPVVLRHFRRTFQVFSKPASANLSFPDPFFHEILCAIFQSASREQTEIKASNLVSASTQYI